MDLFEEIAQLVPTRHRANYWRMLARLKHLHPDDEILIILWGMGILALVFAQIPMSLIQALFKAERIARRLEALNRDFAKNITKVALSIHRPSFSSASSLLSVEEFRQELKAHYKAIRSMLWTFAIGIICALLIASGTICVVLCAH